MDQSHVSLGSLNLERALEGLSSRRALFVPTAANGLDDRADIVDAYRSQLLSSGVEVVDWDVETRRVSAEIPDVDAVFVSGGDPYRLLDACRSSAFDRVICKLVEAGVPYIGASAGAMVAGPSLDPIVTVSPFARPHRFDGTALGLADRLVLPHDDRPGRRDAHAATQRTHGGSVRMVAITDDEVITIRAGDWRLDDQASDRGIRPAVHGDAASIADCYVRAGRAAWHFVEPGRLETMDPPVSAWEERIRALPDRDDLLVLEDEEGLGGFGWARRASDGDLDTGFGEIGAFYTHPRLWGHGAGRRLLTLVLDRLRALRHHTAVLYTEERNHRPRRLYERLGWRTDGAARNRDFVGVPIREVRYRLPL